jgi:bifunctional DNase/RNase
VELDARPSDALALAVRAGVRIYAAESVLDAAALGQDAAPLDEDGEGIGSGVRPETIGEWPPDPRLDVFREFVNSLDEMPGEGAEGGRSS